VPDAAIWKEKAVALRHSAAQQRSPLERQTLLTLAEDCEAIAVELDAQSHQPGKPKPPGNPPRPPGRDPPEPIREPPRPTPPPPVEPPPPPITAQKPHRPR
jgi:periplasmic protein TonB